MPSSFLPSREGDLISFSANFNAKINVDPVAYGLTLQQGTDYTALHDAFVAAWNVLQDPDTRTQPNTVAKNEAKVALIDGPGGIRELVNVVQSNPSTTDQQRAELQITIPDREPTPIPVPTVPPSLSIVSVTGRIIKGRLENQESVSSRAKPEGVTGATVLYHAGDTAPDDPALWVFAKNTSRTSFDVEIPPSVPAGSRIWLTAFWFTARKESSPAASPESACISGGLAQAA